MTANEVQGSLRRRTKTFLAASVGSLLAASALPAAAYVRPGTTEVVSVSTSEHQGEYCRKGDVPTQFCPNSPSAYSPFASSLSANGRTVAFASAAGGLVKGDTNGHSDVFVRNLDSGVTRIASVSSEGQIAAGHAGGGVDGVTVGPKYYGSHGGAWAMALSYDPSINANGRYVAFTSAAANLVPGDTNLAVDVFVRDLKTARTERISVNSKGEEGVLDPAHVTPPALLLGTAVPDSFYPSISADGRYVSFSSFASNFADRDTNGWADVFVHDRKTDRTTRISTRANGGQAQMLTCESQAYDCRPWTPRSSISSSGRWVTYDTSAPDLVGNDRNGIPDVFVHDRKTRKVERISLGSNGEEAEEIAPQSGWSGAGSSLTGSGNFYSAGRSISRNGRYVTFVSRAGNLIPSDRNPYPGITGDWGAGQDVFVRDRKTDRTRRISVSSVGIESDYAGKGKPIVGNLHYQYPSISSNGRFVTFQGLGLVEGRYTSTQGIYVHDLLSGATDFTSPMIAEHDGETGPAESLIPDISSTGRFLSFASSGWPEGAGAKDRTKGIDYFVRDRGDILGTGRGAGAVEDKPEGEPPTCVQGLCLPPGPTSGEPEPRRILRQPEHDLVGGSLVARRSTGDLFLTVEVQRLSRGVSDAGTLYGARFQVKGATYEVRASAAPAMSLARIGLFRCAGGRCNELSRLQGGYGTTGERIVTAIPTRVLGGHGAEAISRIRLFSGRGTYLSGAGLVHDQLRIR